MQVREAKDFLVQETAKQASIEGVPLFDLEKRMMYFTENEEMSEDPIALNDEFETKCDTDEYEAKICGLLHRAHARIKRENPETARQWKQAIREISKGDHYLPVLWGSPLPGYRAPRQARASHDFLKLLGTGLLVAVVLVGVAFLVNARTRMPIWVQQLLIFGLVGSYLYFAILPLIMKKSPRGVGGLWSKVFRVGTKDNPQR